MAIICLGLLVLALGGGAEGKPVARLLDQDIRLEDCVSPTLGIGSPAVGLESLVEAAMMEELGKTESIELTAEDFRAYIARSAEARERLPNPPADREFDVARAEMKLAAIRAKLGKKGLPLLERKALEEQEEARAASIEYGSEDAAVAVATMPRLKFYGAIHRKYGGAVYAAGLGLVPADALKQLRADMEKSGKIRIEDESLREELEARAEAIRKPELIRPAGDLGFRWPFFLEF